VKPRDAERSKNFFALGLISWMYTRPEQPTIDWINAKFGSKPTVRDANLAAFRAGHAFGETAELFDHPYTVPPYEKPAGYTRDYLEVLNAALAGPGAVDVENDSFTVHNPTALAATPPMPVLVAALGPVMLQIAGEHADGTVLWMADEKAIGEHIAPKINKAAAEAGRPAPRVVAGIPVCLCANSEIDAAKDRANRILAEAETSPNYQKLLDRGDARNVGDLCAAGDEESILARFKQFADAGVTDLSVRLLPIGATRDELVASKYRTREVIGELAKAVR
jgi:F420-dependent oxidoreductase-like protein